MKYETSLDLNVSEQEKAFRSFISNDPALTYFLETGSMRKNAKFSREEIYKDPQFLAFIAPYFEDLYVKAVLRSFDTRDTNLISDVAANPLLLDDAHKQKAFSRILSFLEDKKTGLISYANKIQLGEGVNVITLSQYIGIINICILNYLPIEFQAFRTAYCKEIIKLARTLVSGHFNLALNIMTDTRQLKCDTQTTQEADALYLSLEEAAQKANAAANIPEASSSPMGIVWGAIVFIIIIIRIILRASR